MCISDSSYSLHILFIFSSYSLHLSCCGLSQIVSLHLRKARTVKLHEVNFESALLEKNYEKRHIASMLEELHLVQRVATSGLKSRVESPLLNGIQEEGSYHDWVLRNEMDSVTTVLRQCYDSVTTVLRQRAMDGTSRLAQLAQLAPARLRKVAQVDQVGAWQKLCGPHRFHRFHRNPLRCHHGVIIMFHRRVPLWSMMSLWCQMSGVPSPKRPIASP